MTRRRWYVVKCMIDRANRECAWAMLWAWERERDVW